MQGLLPSADDGRELTDAAGPVPDAAQPGAATCSALPPIRTAGSADNAANEEAEQPNREQAEAAVGDAQGRLPASPCLLASPKGTPRSPHGHAHALCSPRAFDMEAQRVRHGRKAVAALPNKARSYLRLSFAISSARLLPTGSPRGGAAPIAWKKQRSTTGRRTSHGSHVPG